jgi:hypothetical protein
MKLLEHTNQLSPRTIEQQMSPQQLKEKSKSELKNITVFGRHNRHVPVYTDFDATNYQKAFSPERM